MTIINTNGSYIVKVVSGSLGQPFDIIDEDYIYINKKSDKKKKSSIYRFQCDKVSDYRTLIEDFVKVIDFMKYINFVRMVQ